MGDTLEIFGNEYENVAGFKVKDANGNVLTYTRGGGGGYVTQDANGNIILPHEGDGEGGSGINKTYIVKDGQVLSGYSLTPFDSTVLTAEEDNGNAYLKATVNGNNYGGLFSNTIDLTDTVSLVVELQDVNDCCGWTWHSSLAHGYIGFFNSSTVPSSTEATNSNCTVSGAYDRFPLVSSQGYIHNSKYIIGLSSSATATNGYLKFSVSGSSNGNAYINIKNIYLIQIIVPYE